MMIKINILASEGNAEMLVSEMDTVVKRILPYLRRRGYVDEVDLDFETPMKLTTRYSLGYADIIVTAGKQKPYFLVEAKRDSRNLSVKDRDQAIDYGRSLKVPFVVVTNGKTIQCFNTKTKKPLKWNGKLTEKIPSRSDLPKVLAAFKTNPETDNIVLGDGESPFRPALPLKQLNALFKRCHNAIPKIEKNEENAFSDFSKLLFLKLLEEKSDFGLIDLPYSYRFDELAERPASEADQVKNAVLSMLKAVKEDMGYGDVLAEKLYLKSPKTFRYIVDQISGVYFSDSNLDSKGAAFEYFVRATLKGKKLGQYFTPRPLIQLMVCLYGKDKITNALRSGDQPRVLDPSCGTGGFLVYLMTACQTSIEKAIANDEITKSAGTKLIKKLQQDTFFGADANEGVACAAKMNMVVAGDGHTNIKAEDSLALSATIWNSNEPSYDVILTNPPFGTSESESLSANDLQAFPISGTKGQHLFLQKMIQATKPGGEICTVIDEGVLNVDTASGLRKWMLQQCRLVSVVRLPEETFKPNKINVRSSVLHFKKLDHVDHDLENNYSIAFCDVKSLGYEGSGDIIRNFDLQKLLNEISTKVKKQSLGSPRQGYNWTAFDIPLSEVSADSTFRLDLKYWDPSVRKKIADLLTAGAVSLKELNLINTLRGRSPSAELYVDPEDGYAAVIKAGSNINKFGEVTLDGDFIEQDIYSQIPERARICRDDVLLASTGDGTLGKCGVYESDAPAIADGHVTIVRPNKKRVDPSYLADYLRAGFGAVQIQRLYSGSTGLIELTPDHVNSVVVDLIHEVLGKQRARSAQLRDAESKYRDGTSSIEDAFKAAISHFANPKP